jgi:23S rRNA U2552 (ribose-2'-O)-methylase RlmE/FtsJ
MWSYPPWENSQFVSFQGPLPKLAHIQEGWKEMEHDKIIEYKNKISHVESHEEWELRKKITNPYEAIFSGNSDNTFPSLAKVHPLSRSYFKMIEMLKITDFWKTVSPAPFKSAHVCEGPGGFLQAIIENVKNKKLPIDSIYAMTLRPTKSHIPGWRRSIHFLKRFPQIQLNYGEDDTGNIMSQDNQKHFSSLTQGSQIFTADGGFDFSVDYNNQEQLAFPLLMASFTIGLECLAKGGTMIVKLFDIYSQSTQDLFLGTSRLFKRFTIYKPATSRPCNSERYFIATGYVGNKTPSSAQWIRHLKEAQIKHEKSPLTRLIDDTWPPEIMRAIHEQIEWQEKQQIAMIEETLNFNKETLEENVARNISMSRAWCQAFEVPCI